jgi:hypothetical protein
VGSILVLYNHDVNCYNLPDSFVLDSMANTYYIPVGPAITENHLEQYAGVENTSVCSYCSDTGTTVFADSTDWMTTAGFDSVQDGLQVLCPGCSPNYVDPPYFYHGIGYGPALNANGSLMVSAVLKNSAGAGYKFVTTAATASQLVQHSKWSIAPADTAGPVPPTLGNVIGSLYSAVNNHTLALPCCGDLQERPRGNGKDVRVTDAPQIIRAYPNPTTMMLYFEFPVSKEATVRLTDITGREMDKQVIRNGSNAQFSVKGYTPGMYMYQVVTDGKTQTGKVLIME